MNKRVTTSTMTITLSTGELEMYWVVVPDGMTSEVAWTTQERHGPFGTDAEVRANIRRTFLGPDVKVIYGGMWDPKWDEIQ
jgi:hypothetical protein